jgi:phosphoribosylaminoimidazole-succinocarboxamide synthase
MSAVPDGLVAVHRGKVRELYRTPAGDVLIVASDRISAFDYILRSTIPDKGRILTAMTAWWLGQLGDLV